MGLKLCPRLAKYDIFKSDYMKEEVAKICLNCPLDKYGLPCIYDKPGPISKEDRGILLGGEDEEEIPLV